MVIFDNEKCSYHQTHPLTITEGTTSLMTQLSCQRKDLHVYHRDHAPARWHLGGQGRIEDIVLDLAKGIQVFIMSWMEMSYLRIPICNRDRVET